MFNSSGPEYFCSSFPFESVTLFLRQYQFNFIPGRSTPKRITGIQYCCFCAVNLSSFSTLVMSDSDRTEFLLFFNFKNITVLQLGVLEFLSSVKRTFFLVPRREKSGQKLWENLSFIWKIVKLHTKLRNSSFCVSVQDMGIVTILTIRIVIRFIGAIEVVCMKCENISWKQF